jgi:hypothetical protein
LGPVTLKGWTQAIPIWQVLGATDVESRFEARQKSKFALLIGRVPRSRWFLAIPYRAFELRQHAIEYVTRIPAGIFMRHFSIHAQKRIAIFFERKCAFFVERIS